MTIFYTLRCLQSDRAISSTCFHSFGDLVEGRWPWICDAIARHSDCDSDDVECVEDDAGRDVFTARGEAVAYLDCGDGLANFDPPESFGPPVP